MLVSHDRALLRTVCDEFWLVGSGAVAPFEGDLDDYQRYLLDMAKKKRESLSSASAGSSAGNTPANISEQPDKQTSTAPSASQPALSGAELRKQQAAQRQLLQNQRRPLQKQIAQLEAEMAQLEAEKTQLETSLCQPLPPPELAAAGKQLKTVTQALEQAETRWLEVSAELEAIG